MEEKIHKPTISKLDKLFKESVSRLEERTKSRSTRSFLTTGFEKLDDTLGGWEPGEVIVIGARPSMGKTAFLVSMMKQITRRSDYAVGMISLESPISHLMERIVAFEAGIPVTSLKKAKLGEEEWNRILDAMSGVKKDKIFLVEDPKNSIDEIIDAIEQLVGKHDVKVVMLDYLQLVEGMERRRNREQEVSSVIRAMKRLARELEIVIVLASQLNRSVDLRSGNKRPYLSDLRDSGAIEEDTDKVIFIHRPWVYDIMEDERGNSLEGLAEMIIAKNRTGPTGEVMLNFDSNFGRFYEIITDPAAFGDISPDDLPDHGPPF